MALKPEASIMTGLAVAALVGAIYSKALPTMADLRVGAPGDTDANASRTTAAWSSAGAVAAVSLIAKDRTVFVLGAAMIVAVDWWTRHSNEHNPAMSQFMPGDGHSPTLTPDVQYDDGSGALVG